MFVNRRIALNTRCFSISLKARWVSDLALCVTGCEVRWVGSNIPVAIFSATHSDARFLLPVDLHLLDVSVLGQLVIPWLSFLSVATFERNAASLTFCWKCVREAWKRGGSVPLTETHPTASGNCHSHIPAKERLFATDVCPTFRRTSGAHVRGRSCADICGTSSRNVCETSRANVFATSGRSVRRTACPFVGNHTRVRAHIARADGTSVHFGSDQVGCVCVFDGFGAAFNVGQRATRKAWPERRCVCVLGF